MSSLSIRRLPKELEKALLHESRTGRKTKTGIVLEALEERFHLGKKALRLKRLREFFGKMSRSEYQAFQEATRDFSKIEKDLWN